MEDYLQQLNGVQQEAVTTINGPVLVIAGAGSGKTRVLTYRIAHLVQMGINPFSILALTFTNKAAKEMKGRVIGMTGSHDAGNIWIGTFHSMFARILRVESEKLGYPNNFTIYDTQDSKNLIKSIVKELGLDEKVYKPGMLLNRISLSKNNLISSQAYLNNTDLQREDHMQAKPETGSIYDKYVTRCFKAGAMDFDDLLYNTNRLLTEFPDALHKYQHKFSHTLIDEFQDTNALQYTIIKKLSAVNENICVVGDDAQSIYGFRGANIQNILDFKKDYPDLKVFKLEQNYRSTRSIVNAANSVIANNKQQLHKEVWTDNPEGEKLTLINALTDNEEGFQVARTIFEQKANGNLQNRDFAIVYRTNAQSRSMEEALRKINISYRIYGGLSFYQRKEVKDLLAYFRLAVNNNDEEALKRVINYPARGIGLRSFEKIIVAASEGGITPWEVISNLRKFRVEISSGIEEKFLDFSTMIKSFSAQLLTKNANDLGELISSSSGLVKGLYNNQTPEGLSSYENIQELLGGLKEYTENWEAKNEMESNGSIMQEPGLGIYLQEISLLTDDAKDDPNDNNRVSLMTIHAAKGLEFPVVFIVGMEENLFPSQLSLNSREDLEEERRLFYVALTRSKKKAFLSNANTRYRWGTLIHCEPSRFLEEIDAKYIEKAGFIRKEKFKNKSGWYVQKKSKANKSQSRPKPKLTSSPTAVSSRKLINMDNAVHIPEMDSNSASGQIIQKGMQVEHQRFGTGEVLQIEGANANKKAVVHFDGIGEKQLLLKYARLKILNQ